MVTDGIAQTVAKLKATRDGYLNAVTEDSTNPQKDYSLEGRNVSRSQWRTSLLNNIKEINQLLTQYEPFESTSIMM